MMIVGLFIGKDWLDFVYGVFVFSTFSKPNLYKCITLAFTAM